MFRTVPMSIIRSFSLYTQQWYMSYSFADSLRAGSRWDCSSILILLASCPQNCMTYHCCVHSEKLLMMDRGTVRNMQSFIPRINLRNQCIQLVLLQEFIMMHGNMNFKYPRQIYREIYVHGTTFFAIEFTRAFAYFELNYK